MSWVLTGGSGVLEEENSWIGERSGWHVLLIY